ncbi:hypothetical protein [Ruegeria jejuensis]|uniref:hypothetical protein n=1 Tax=Ruegeria jejuensis TaxID=3233338 RepID=UPI00355C2FF5
MWYVEPDLQDLDISDPGEFEEGPSEFNLELRDLLRRHFEKFDRFDGESYNWLAHYLVFDQAHELDEFWSAKNVLDDLAKLRSRLREADDIIDRLPVPVGDAFRIGALNRSGLLAGDGTVDDSDGRSQERLEQTPYWQAYMAQDKFFKKVHLFLDLIEDAEEKAKEGEPVGKKAIEAWRLVEACVGLCERHPGTIDVPKAMNESGPFYRFLSDIFELFEIEELPTSSYRSWKRYVGR